MSVSVCLVQLLVRRFGSSETHKEFRRSAMHLAAMHGDAAIIRLLHDKGGDVNVRDKVGSKRGCVWVVEARVK